MSAHRYDVTISNIAHNKRILVVDDNEDFAHTLATILNVWGHQTSIAYDGETALQKASAFAPDIVILDIRMPGLNGYDTAAQFRNSLFGRTLLIISVSGEYADVVNHGEVDHHIQKPIDFNLLKTLVDSMAE